MPAQTPRAGRPRRVLVLAVAAVCGLAGLGALGLSSASAFKAEAAVVSDFDAKQAATLLRRLGLTPEAMAAAGLSTIEARRVMQAALTYQFHQDLSDATRALNRRLSAPPPRPVAQSVDPAGPGAQPVPQPGAQPTPQPTPQPTATLAAARQRLDQRLDHALAHVTSQLTADQRQALATIRANADRAVPTRYLTVNRSNAEWIALRGALSARRVAAASGRPLDPRAAQTLSIADAQPGTALAAQRIQTWSRPISDAWSQVLPVAPVDSDRP